MNGRPHVRERVIIHLAMCDDWSGELVVRELENEWVLPILLLPPQLLLPLDRFSFQEEHYRPLSLQLEAFPFQEEHRGDILRRFVTVERIQKRPSQTGRPL